MKLGLITAYSRSSPTTVTLISGNPHAKTATLGVKFPSSFRLNSGYKISSFSLTICSSKSSSSVDSAGAGTETYNQTVDGEISSPQVTESLNIEVGSPKILPNYFPPKLSLSDQAFFLLTFIACTVLLIKFSMSSFLPWVHFLVENLSVFEIAFLKGKEVLWDFLCYADIRGFHKSGSCNCANTVCEFSWSLGWQFLSTSV